MVFNGTALFFVLLIGSVVWLAVLSVFVLRMIGHYNRLTKGATASGLREVLDDLLKNQQATGLTIGKLQKEISRVDRDGAFHIQRIGIVRFNPFSDTGGSQSFTMAILDGSENGIVVTSLYARTGNRWYVKEIRQGQGSGVELSKEEQTAIKQAKRLEANT